MARARNIKPSILKNEVLGTSDPLCTLLFQGLWMLADRAGRLEDRPLRIKAEVFPYRDANVDALLKWLHERGFIARYTVDGIGYIQVCSFLKHQNPHKNEVPSIIPEMERATRDITRAVPEDSGASSDFIGTTRADSLNLIPSSLIPLTLIPSLSPSGDGASADFVYPDAFEQFWNAFPKRAGKRRGKEKSFRLWKQVPAAERGLLVTAATNYASSDEAHRGFAKDPERFIAADWWRDWITPADQQEQIPERPQCVEGDEFDYLSYMASVEAHQ